jgi:glycosyltransferase involved in cell wall biosynthesis
MSRLLWFNFACDEDDPALGFATSWIRAIRPSFDAIDVITWRAGRFGLSQGISVFPLAGGSGANQLQKMIAFYRHLIRLLAKHRYVAAFSHMNPLAAALAAPLLRMRGIRLVLWYVHPRVDWRLRLANRAADEVVTAFVDTYPLPHDRLRVIGHGIDTDHFTPGAGTDMRAPVILYAGRLSAAKNQKTLILAADELRRRGAPAFQVMLLGNPLTGVDRIYAAELAAMVEALGLDETVAFAPAVAWKDMPDWYRTCRLHVNLARTGFGDKTPLEALSCGRLSLVAAAGFRATLGTYADELLVAHDNPIQLADRVQALLEMDAVRLRQIGQDLRRRVESEHGLAGLAQRLAGLLA